MNTSPSPLSPELERGMATLREFAAAWPLLGERISGFYLNSDGKVVAQWSYSDPANTFQAARDAALASQEAGKWRKKGCGSSWSYVLSAPDLELTIPYAEPMEFAVESAAIDFEKLKGVVV